MTSKFSAKTLQGWYSFSGLPSFYYPKSLEQVKFSESFKTKVKSVLCPTIQEAKELVFYYRPNSSIINNDTDATWGFGYLCSHYIFDKGYCSYIQYRDLLNYLESKELTEKDFTYLYTDVMFINGIKGLEYNEREADLFTSYLYKRITSNKKTVLCLLQEFPAKVQESIGFALKNSIDLWEL